MASLEEDFITWREQFWPAVCEHFGVEATGEESRWVRELGFQGEVPPSSGGSALSTELLSTFLHVASLARPERTRVEQNSEWAVCPEPVLVPL